MENKFKKTWSDLSETERKLEIKRLVANRNFQVLRMIFERVMSQTDIAVYDWFNELADSIIQSTDDNLNPVINRANE